MVGVVSSASMMGGEIVIRSDSDQCIWFLMLFTKRNQKANHNR